MHSWKEITVRTDFWLDKHPLQKSRQTFLITLFSRKMLLTYFKEMCLEKNLTDSRFEKIKKKWVLFQQFLKNMLRFGLLVAQNIHL